MLKCEVILEDEVKAMFYGIDACANAVDFFMRLLDEYIVRNECKPNGFVYDINAKKRITYEDIVEMERDIREVMYEPNM